MDSIFKGQVALVTGGTKGIGKAIADTLKDKGAEVIVTARNTPEADINGYYFIAADLTQPESAETIAKEIIEKYGRRKMVYVDYLCFISGKETLWRIGAANTWHKYTNAG